MILREFANEIVYLLLITIGSIIKNERSAIVPGAGKYRSKFKHVH